jgi:hypothetical protein
MPNTVLSYEGILGRRSPIKVILRSGWLHFRCLPADLGRSCVRSETHGQQGMGRQLAARQRRPVPADHLLQDHDHFGRMTPQEIHQPKPRFSQSRIVGVEGIDELRKRHEQVVVGRPIRRPSKAHVRLGNGPGLSFRQRVHEHVQAVAPGGVEGLQPGRN